MPCDWTEFEEKQRREGNTVRKNDEPKSVSTEPIPLEQEIYISISSDEENTTHARGEKSDQNRGK